MKPIEVVSYTLCAMMVAVTIESRQTAYLFLNSRSNIIHFRECPNPFMPAEEHAGKMLAKIISNSYPMVEVRRNSHHLSSTTSPSVLLGLSTYGDKKRKSFTHLHSFDDTDLAYRSASDYLRQSKQESPTIESLEMMLTRNIPRTKSASEMTPRNQRKTSRRVILHSIVCL